MSKTFAEAFSDLRDRALALGETYNQEADAILDIACQCESLALEAKAGGVPYGGSYGPWSAYIDEKTKALDTYEKCYAQKV